MIQNRATDKPSTPHWVRFRRLLRIVALIGALLSAMALLWMYRTGTPMPWPAVLAVGLGVFLTVLLTGTLMGLVFASSRGEHDAEVGDADSGESRR